jgi:prepilin-type N-terminal cleavage/methylation domain-containing protein
MRLGFTLLELLTVLAILGILSAIGLASIQGSVDASKRSTAAITTELIVATINAKGRLDPSIKGLSMRDNDTISEEVFDDSVTLRPSGVDFFVEPVGQGAFEVHARSKTGAWSDVCRTNTLDNC